MFEYTTLILLVGLNILQFVSHYLERKDMTDRLMSRNLEEYKDNVKPEKNVYTESEDTNLVDITEAREEILNS